MSINNYSYDQECIKSLSPRIITAIRACYAKVNLHPTYIRKLSKWFNLPENTVYSLVKGHRGKFKFLPELDPRVSKPDARSGERWSTWESLVLIKLHANGCPKNKLALALFRTTNAITKHLSDLRLQGLLEPTLVARRNKL